MQSFLYMRAR